MGWLREAIVSSNPEVTPQGEVKEPAAAPAEEKTDVTSTPDGKAENGDGKGVPAAAAGDEGDKKPAPVVEPKQPEKIKVKLKADGNEEEVELTTEELVAYRQRMHGFEKMARQAESKRDKAEKQAQAIIEMAKSDPWTLIKQLGIDPDAAAEEYLKKRVSELEMTPEQRKQAELEREVATLRAAQEQALKAEEERKQEAAASTVRERLQADIITELEKSSLPRDRQTVGEIATLMYYSKQAAANGEVEAPLGVAEAVAVLEERYREHAKRLAAVKPPAEIADEVGKKALASKKNVNKDSSPSMPKKKMTVKEWLEERKKQLGAADYIDEG